MYRFFKHFKLDSSLFLTLLTLPLVGCSSNQLMIESTPDGADIYITSNHSKHKIGKTPLSLDNSNASALFKEPFQISIQKDGYRTESFLVPASSTSAKGRLFTELSPTETATTTKEVSEAVAQILRMIYRKSYAEAERTLSTYTSKYSTIPIFWDLLGNVHYLQKNLDAALRSYETALNLNPQNGETQKMISKIKSIRGNAE